MTKWKEFKPLNDLLKQKDLPRLHFLYIPEYYLRDQKKKKNLFSLGIFLLNFSFSNINITLIMYYVKVYLSLIPPNHLKNILIIKVMYIKTS